MIVDKANICDICKSRLSQNKCEICGNEICSGCSSSKHISVRGIKIFDYPICRNCNLHFEGLKTEVVIKQETIADIKAQLNEQLKKALILKQLEGANYEKTKYY